MGIARPDLRTPEQKAAADRIEIGYGDGFCVFRCTECGRTSAFPPMIEHASTCETGMVLAKMLTYLTP